jgi:hypothetical protein
VLVPLGLRISHHITCKFFGSTSGTSAYVDRYIYGGYGFGANATGFDDLYILSLPTFTWIPWWNSSGVGVPHHSLTCNVVGGQMLIIGGTFPLNSNCDVPMQWGTHNVDLGKVSGKPWITYNNNVTSYVVPPEVIAVVGGS